MIGSYQLCRVCGVRVPSGFTNCDGCYRKPVKVVKALKVDKPKAIFGFILVTAMFFLSQAVHAESIEAFKPFPVYSDASSLTNHFSPSGFMGDYGDIQYDGKSLINPHSGSTCIRIAYSGVSTQHVGWTGIYWQNPANNWGGKEGGYNLIGAIKLTFWARGEKGGERIEEFKIGGITGEHADSDVAGIGPVILTTQWQQFSIDLIGKNLESISGGFGWSTNLDANGSSPIVFYLDDIKYE